MSQFFSERDQTRAYVPFRVFGRTRLVQLPVTGDPREFALAKENEARVIDVSKRRLYVAGEQYAAENTVTAEKCGLNPEQDRLPEHMRKHAYSTQLAESVEYLSDRLSEGWAIRSDDPGVQRVLDDLVAANDTISAEDEDGDVVMVTDDLLRDAMIAGDVPVYVGWDPVEQLPVLDFWESEHVEVQMASTKLIEKVIRTDIVWRADPTGTMTQQVQRVEYQMAVNPQHGHEDCQVRTWYDNDPDPVSQAWLGVGRVPWTLMRCDARGLRQTRGESLVTDQAMEAADRYNSVLQNAYLAGRYNSHGNLAVIGDAASIGLDYDGRLNKDVADVLRFPGGTQLSAITLPTDMAPTEQQRKLLTSSMYATFGLTQVDQDTLFGLGGVSGYALEILNAKSEAAFGRISRFWRKDWGSLLNLVLDVVAWKQGVTVAVDADTLAARPIADQDIVDAQEQGLLVTGAYWDVDPDQVFPNRKLAIPMGTGFVVDEVLVRDDFVAKLISRAEALRQRGMSPDDITRIEEELAGEAPPPPEVGLFGAVAPNGLKAGGTVSTVTPAATQVTSPVNGA
jgi:hypothetical protein